MASPYINEQSDVVACGRSIPPNMTDDMLRMWLELPNVREIERKAISNELLLRAIPKYEVERKAACRSII